MSNKKQLKKYFWEIMREFFAVWTPKFYKVNISNPKRLLEELQNYIFYTEWNWYLQADHIKYLIEEYLYRSWKDIIYKKYNKNYQEFNEFLRKSIEEKSSNITNIKQNEFYYFIDDLKNRLNPVIRNLQRWYFSETVKQLLDILNKKEEDIKPWDFTLLKKVCYSFSTEILRKWYSRYYIYENTNKFLISTSDKESDFISLFDDRIKKYDIYIKILTRNEDIKEIFKNNFWSQKIFEKFPFKINNSFIQKDSEKNQLNLFLRENENWFKSFYLKIENNAIDYINASNKAVQDINILLDEVKFEYINDNINIFHHALVQENGLSNFSFPYISSYLYIHRKDSSVSFLKSKSEQIKKIYESDIIDDSTKEKLKTIFRFYRYFLESNTLEHKFLNLWIWWEHIFSLNFKKESQTWKNIQLYYPFIDSITLIEDILKDMIQVQLNRKINNLDALLSNDHKYIITNLYKIIKDKWEKWDKLLKYECLLDNDLVKVKLFRLHEKFKSPKKFVENNKNKIKWNLYRLYRVRNSIVHKWNIDFLWLPIEMLTSDLENYYTNLLDIILNRFSANDRFENMEQLFVSIQETYNSFQKQEWISEIIDTEDIKRKIINLPLIF